MKKLNRYALLGQCAVIGAGECKSWGTDIQSGFTVVSRNNGYKTRLKRRHPALSNQDGVFLYGMSRE